MATRWQKLMCCKCAVLLSIVQSSAVAPQTSFLLQKISDIAAQARGPVAVACSLPGIALDCDVNGDAEDTNAICFQAAPGSGRLA